MACGAFGGRCAGPIQLVMDGLASGQSVSLPTSSNLVSYVRCLSKAVRDL